MYHVDIIKQEFGSAKAYWHFVNERSMSIVIDVRWPQSVLMIIMTSFLYYTGYREKVSMTRKCLNHTLQTNSWHREDETNDTYRKANAIYICQLKILIVVCSVIVAFPSHTHCLLEPFSFTEQLRT